MKELVGIPGDGNCLFNSILLGYMDLHKGNPPNLSKYLPTPIVINKITQLELRLAVKNFYQDKFDKKDESFVHCLQQTLMDLIETGSLSGISGELKRKLSGLRQEYLQSQIDLVSRVDHQLIQDYINAVPENWGGGQEIEALQTILKTTILPNQVKGVNPLAIELSYQGGNHFNVYISNQDTLKDFLPLLGIKTTGVNDQTHLYDALNLKVLSSPELDTLPEEQFFLLFEIIFKKREAKGKSNSKPISDKELAKGLQFLKNRDRRFNKGQLEPRIPGNSIYKYIKPKGFDDKIKIFNSQFNVALLIYQCWRKRNVLKEGKKYEDLNLLFIGPSDVDLRNQTAHDLAMLASNISLFPAPNFSSSEPKEIAKYIEEQAGQLVYNSNKLKGKKLKKKMKESERIGKEFNLCSDSDDRLSDDSADTAKDDADCGKVYDKYLQHIKFLNRLQEENASENLHIIIHDEAHWGIKNNSLIDKFFLRVLEIMNAFPSNQKPTLLILLVSATAKVIQLPVTAFTNDQFTINWENLKGLAYKTPLYRSIDKLHYVNVEDDPTLLTPQLKHKKGQTVYEMLTVVQRSRVICESYLHAASEIASQLDAKKALIQLKLETASAMALSSLLCDDANSVKMSDLKEYRPLSERNKIVFIRVQNKGDAETMATKIKHKFVERLRFCPFEIIRLISGRTLSDDLSKKGLQYLRGGKEANYLPLRVKDLVDIPVLIIAIKKLQMGERLPANCAYFDVRVPYKGLYENVESGHETKFIQDVGRCAGHKNSFPSPVILLALNQRDVKVNEKVFSPTPTLKNNDKESSPTPTLKNNDKESSPTPTFVKVHPLIQPQRLLPTVHHTEHKTNSHVYTRLTPYAVLLNAAPQIGKTGTFLSLIELLFCNHITRAALIPSPAVPEVDDDDNEEEDDDDDDDDSKVQPQDDHESDPEPENEDIDRLISRRQDKDNDRKKKQQKDEFNPYGNFHERCQYLKNLVNTLGDSALQDIMKDDYFRDFHQLLKDTREGTDPNPNLNETIVNYLAIAVNNGFPAASSNGLTIADCGCGMYGVTLSLNQVLNKKKKFKTIDELTVFGYDLDPAIAETTTDLNEKLKFSPIIGNFYEAEAPITQFNVVVFNCSLWLNDATAVLHRAFEHLSEEGLLFIIDLPFRFPSNLTKLLLDMGWDYPDEDLGLPVQNCEQKPYLFTVWQKLKKPLNKSIAFIMNS